MPPNMRMMKVPEYPRPHDWQYNFAIPMEQTASQPFATICPIITYDEGLGAMSAYESNPSNAAFVEAATDHCFPTSKVNRVFAELKVQMSKIMLETDKVHAVRFATAEIHTSFMDGELALDEVSTLDLNEILELQNEQTDRQTFPLYNATDLKDFKINAGLDMPAEQAGLDTDLEIEGVTFDIDDYYDCLHYYTNGNKLRNICTQLKWHTLTRQHPITTVFFNQQSNTKSLNPYTFLGGLIYVPTIAQIDQFGKPGDTTIDTCTLEFMFHGRFNEFNHEFNHSML